MAKFCKWLVSLYLWSVASVGFVTQKRTHKRKTKKQRKHNHKFCVLGLIVSTSDLSAPLGRSTALHLKQSVYYRDGELGFLYMESPRESESSKDRGRYRSCKKKGTSVKSHN